MLYTNNAPHTSLDSFNIAVSRPTAFNGGTTNDRGDEGGTADPFTLFEVTGDVLAGVYGVCTTDLTGSGSISLGITGNTTLFNAATTGTTIDANEVWLDTAPAIGKSIDGLSFYIIGNGVDIVEDYSSDTITAGNIYYVCLWRPLSPGSKVVSSYP